MFLLLRKQSMFNINNKWCWISYNPYLIYVTFFISEKIWKLYTMICSKHRTHSSHLGCESKQKFSGNMPCLIMIKLWYSLRYMIICILFLILWSEFYWITHSVKCFSGNKKLQSFWTAYEGSHSAFRDRNYWKYFMFPIKEREKFSPWYRTSSLASCSGVRYYVHRKAFSRQSLNSTIVQTIIQDL